MTALPIRIRGPNGSSTLQLSPDQSVEQLLLQLSTITDIPVEKIQIRSGVPPKPLSIPNDRSLTVLEALRIQRGDTLIISASSTVPTLSSAPSVTQKAAIKSGKIEGTYVSAESGNLVIRIVPDDNSCLFRAAGMVLLPEVADLVPRLRHSIVDAIKADPETYSDAILGQPRQLYASHILKPSSWGGAIELSILSQAFQTEIAAADVQSGRIDRYGEGFDKRVLLLYSGIHYDACTLSPLPPEDFGTLAFDTRIFSAGDDLILEALLRLADELKQKHYYTDVAKFTLRCEICKTALVGEKDATAHAKQTGHARFGEY